MSPSGHTSLNEFLPYGDESDNSEHSDKLIGAMLKQHVQHSQEGHIAGKHPVSFAALNLILVTKERGHMHGHTHIIL